MSAVSPTFDAWLTAEKNVHLTMKHTTRCCCSASASKPWFCFVEGKLYWAAPSFFVKRHASNTSPIKKKCVFRKTLIAAKIKATLMALLTCNDKGSSNNHASDRYHSCFKNNRWILGLTVGFSIGQARNDTWSIRYVYGLPEACGSLNRDEKPR